MTLVDAVTHMDERPAAAPNLHLWEIGKHQDIMRVGDTPRTVHLLQSGFACRYHLSESGRRQIMAILVPGDICNLEPFMQGRADYSVCALTNCRISDAPVGEFTDDVAGCLKAYKFLRVNEAIGRQWIINLGRKSALERVAHLYCEMHVRLSRVGMVHNDEFVLPIIQSDLADMLGLSTVHINRSLQYLRSRNLISNKNSRVLIRDRPALEALAHFNKGYLFK